MTETNTTIALTDAIVRKAIVPEGKAEIYLKESRQLPCLALRVRASGSKTFVLLTTRPGRKGTHRVNIGKPSDLFKVADARKQAAILAGEHAKGTDLIEQKRARKRDAVRARKEARDVMTLDMLIGDDDSPYARARQREGIKSWQFEIGYLRRNLLADHRNTDIRELSRRDIMVAVNKLNDAGKHGAAHAVWKYAYPFLGWCLEQGYLDVNPLAGTRRRRKGSRAERLEREQKGRALNDHEIAAVWNASAGDKFALFGLLAKFCLLAGTRRGEAAMLKWSDVQNDRVVIRPENTKMGKHHAVPRTKLLNEMIEAARRYRRTTGDDYLFPSARTGCQILGFTFQLDRLVRDAGVKRFTMHDLRRTLKTTMSRLGYSDQIHKACVGQEPDSLEARYNKYDFWKERCEAFETYHAHITALIRGDNVVELRPKVA